MLRTFLITVSAVILALSSSAVFSADLRGGSLRPVPLPPIIGEPKPPIKIEPPSLVAPYRVSVPASALIPENQLSTAHDLTITMEKGTSYASSAKRCQV